MKVNEIWKEKSKPSVSFELYPARDEKAAAKLDRTLDKLAEAGPDFVAVTFGAGGSTREGSYGLVRELLKDRGLETVAYFTCYGLAPDDIAEMLDDYRELGVETVLAARGDPPHDRPGFEPHPESLPHASDLVSFIRPRYDFCLAVAGYPEGHVQAESRESDLAYLKLKVDNGADFVITNYCYDNRMFFDFTRRAREAGIRVPILPGVMPVYSVKMMENLAGLCGATITDAIRDGLAALPPDDKQAVSEFGIDFAIRQCRGLIEGGVPGIHIYTMDRAKAATRIVSALRQEGLI